MSEGDSADEPSEDMRKIVERLNELRAKYDFIWEERGKLLHQQFAIAVGTAGAIIFAGLVLVLEDPSPFEKPPLPPNPFNLTATFQFHLVISLLGLLIILSVFSVIATSFVGAGIIKTDSWMGWFGYSSGLATMLGLALAVVILLGDFTPSGSNDLLFAFGILGIIWVVALVYGLARQRPDEMAATR